jgi:hypothetical protein
MLLCAALTACDDAADATAPTDAAALSRAQAAAGTRTAARAQDNRLLVELRRVTAKFHDFERAKADGYEVEVTPCWAHATAGAMGYHYGNLERFDANVALLEPEVLMYEPQAGGHMRLVGMEYIVPLDAWEEAGHDLNDPEDVPELLGQQYTRHSFLPIFKLHIWLWRNNPQGTYADWNPKVSCAHAEHTETF